MSKSTFNMYRYVYSLLESIIKDYDEDLADDEDFLHELTEAVMKIIDAHDSYYQPHEFKSQQHRTVSELKTPLTLFMQHLKKCPFNKKCSFMNI
jgi:C-terminal processing protease CtpA/Prc